MGEEGCYGKAHLNRSGLFVGAAVTIRYNIQYLLLRANETENERRMLGGDFVGED